MIIRAHLRASDELNGLLREQGKIPASFPDCLELRVLVAARDRSAGFTGSFSMWRIRAL